jgi:hypothetical protein
MNPTTTQRFARAARVAPLGVALALSIMASGCVSLAQGTRETKASVGSYAGDRESIDLGAVVVAIPVSADGAEWRNLRVWMEAIVNTRRTTIHERDAWLLVARQRARAQGAATKAIADGVSVAKGLIKGSRDAAEAAAQQAINQGFASWEHAKEFEVIVVVTSIEFVDDSRPSPLATWGR